VEAAKPGTLQWSAWASDLVRPRVVVPVLTALAARSRRFEGVPGNWPMTVEPFVKRRSP
jgi:hypothetical protein